MEADSKKKKPRSEHPLSNFVVLENILGYDKSPETTLRNRLVSKSWLTACERRWTKLEKCLILRYANLEKGLAHEWQLEKSRVLPMTLQEFYMFYQTGYDEVTQMLIDGPRKMELHSWEVLEDVALKKCKENAGINLDHWFWAQTATEWLCKLTLVNCEFRQEIWAFKPNFLKTVPKLEELTLRNCVVHPEAVSAINLAHHRWMSYENKEEWINSRFRRRQENSSDFLNHRIFNREIPETYRNLAFVKGEYIHELLSLDITLVAATKTEKEFVLEPTTPILVWGPLLAMFPSVKKLRIGGYHENLELPPPQLKPPGWDNDTNEDLLRLKREVALHNSRGIDPRVFEKRATWLGDERDIGNGAPAHKGNFWELFWDQAMGQVEASIESLDLLDFSGRAQQYGVLSTCEAAASKKNLYGQGFVYYMPRLRYLSFDLGMDPVFAERDTEVLFRWADPMLTYVKLYRAPFEKVLSRSFGVAFKLKDFELWGNVEPDLTFLRSQQFLHRFSYTTSCYDMEYKGKRIHHLMKEGRKAYLLTGEEIMNNTDWSLFPIYNYGTYGYFERSWVLRLRHVELDWGPISIKNWKQFGKIYLNVSKLKAAFANDDEFAEVLRIWPDLECLEMAHGTLVSAKCLGELLPKLIKLAEFKWVGCACTSEWFSHQTDDLESVKQTLEKELPTVVIPWSSFGDSVTSSGANTEKVCLRAEFEVALQTGDSKRFFELLANEQKASNANLK